MTVRSVCITLLTLFWEKREFRRIFQLFQHQPLIILLFLLLTLFYVYIRLQNSNDTPSLENAQKRKARYPSPHKKLLYKTPPSDCVVLGKWKKQYVCKKLTQDGHVLIVGGSGSGKSSAIAIPTLLTNEKASCFAIDIKGELSKKASNLSDKKNVVFNPKDKSSYGYDPFWCLDNNGASDKQMVYETMEQVVFSLLPMSNTESNPYWTVTGRALLLGLMLYEYRAGYYNLIDIIDQIQSQPIEDLLEEAEEILEDDSMEYRILSQLVK